jgi:hypothetical protein
MVLNGICPFSLEFLDFTWTLLLKKKNARKFIQQQANKESRLLMKATKSASRGCKVRGPSSRA